MSSVPQTHDRDNAGKAAAWTLPGTPKGIPNGNAAAPTTPYHRNVDSEHRSAPDADTIRRNARLGAKSESEADLTRPESWMLDLQRSVGNAATTDLIQRQQLQVQREGFDPSMVSVGAPLQVSGRADSSLNGTQVTIDGPEVSATGTANITLPSDKSLKDFGISQVQVGPTQTALASLRAAEYRVGGLGGGERTSTRKESTGKPRRDAQFDRDKPNEAHVVAPWYSTPTGLNDSGLTGTVNYYDYPGFNLPTTEGRGSLARVYGSDQFRTSFAAKPVGGELHHLVKYDWGVDWSMDIDASGNGQGASTTKPTETDAIPPTLDGPIAKAAAQTWFEFHSIGEAMRHDVGVLLRYLVVSRRHDPAAHATIVDALKQKDPSFNVTVMPKENVNWVLDDDVSVRVASDTGSSVIDLGSLGTTEIGTGSVKLFDLVDPALITESTTITLDIIRSGTFGDDQASKPAGFPFVAHATVAIGSGSYDVVWDVS